MICLNIASLMRMTSLVRSMDPATVPVVSKEDIIDRVIDGLTPSRKTFSIIVDPDGKIVPATDENLRKFIASLDRVYEDMTPEELKTFKETLSHLYRKKMIRQTEVFVGGAAVVLGVIVLHQLMHYLRS